MLESLLITFFPTVFLIILFGGEEIFKLRNIDMDGIPPINPKVFYTSKYAILVPWAGMVMHAWGLDLSLISVPHWLRWSAFSVWTAGFLLLLAGRIGLGESFRIGSPMEATSLRVNGLFRFSRNPMYLGVYATLFASVMYTLNPLFAIIGIFVISVHHQIVLAEEKHLKRVFGDPYDEYCRRVRRYV